MIWCHPNFLNSKKATHGLDHFAGKPGPLVRHQSLREPEYREILIVEHPGSCLGGLVLGHEGLHIPGKVINYHQYILHDRFFLGSYGDFHSDIVNVYQLNRFCTDYRLHTGDLRLGLKLLTVATIGGSKD